MYSVLKTEKHALHHKKHFPVTSSIFLTNKYILITFADSSFSIYSLYLSSPEPETLMR